MDDEKTLKIKVVHDADEDQRSSDQSTQSEPKQVANPKPVSQPQSEPTSLPENSIGKTPSPSPVASPRPTVPSTPVTAPSSPPVPPPAGPAPVAGGAASSMPSSITSVGTGAAGSVAGGGGGALAASAGTALMVVGGVIAGLGALATAVGLVTHVLGNMAERLKDFDPGIAMAEGIREMRLIQADIKAARERSEVLQTITAKRTDIEIIGKDIWTTLTNRIAPRLEKILDMFETAMLLFDGFMKIVGKADEFISKNIPKVAGYVTPFLLDWKELNKQLAKWLGIQLDTQDAKDFQKDLIEALDPHRADVREMTRSQEGERPPKSIRI